jgi:hypothetical protein
MYFVNINAALKQTGNHTTWLQNYEEIDETQRKKPFFCINRRKPLPLRLRKGGRGEGRKGEREKGRKRKITRR